MIVLEKNEGAKIPYSARTTKVTFDDDLTINLAKREEDWPVNIDVCFDEDNTLVIGAAVGRAYVAQIEIPERQYRESEELGEDGEPQREPVPLDMNTVTLVLWSVE